MCSGDLSPLAVFHSAVFLLLHICMYFQRWQFSMRVVFVFVCVTPADFHGLIRWVSCSRLYAGVDSRAMVLFPCALSQCFLLFMLCYCSQYFLLYQILLSLHAVMAVTGFSLLSLILVCFGGN